MNRARLTTASITLGLGALTLTGIAPAAAAQPLTPNAPTAAVASSQDTGAATPAARCSGLSGDQALEKWGTDLPAVSNSLDNTEWALDAADTSTYDPCKPLSWITVPVKGGTGHSPHVIMLFNDGEYVGPATEKNFGGDPTIERLSSSSVKITYTFPREGDSNAQPTGIAVSTFFWDDAESKVVRTGDLPPNPSDQG